MTALTRCRLLQRSRAILRFPGSPGSGKLVDKSAGLIYLRNIRGDKPQSRTATEASIKSTPITYSVIVRNPNSWSASTGIHEELANCGHNHKTFATAQACYDRLTAWRDGSTSALWYQARIEESTGHEIDRDGRQLPTNKEMRDAEFAGCEE